MALQNPQYEIIPDIRDFSGFTVKVNDTFDGGNGAFEMEVASIHYDANGKLTDCDSTLTSEDLEGVKSTSTTLVQEYITNTFEEKNGRNID